MGGHVVGMRKLRNSYKIVIEKPGLKRTLSTPRLKWESNFRTSIRRRC